MSSGSYMSSATVLSGSSATITIPAGALAVGTDALTAAYTPDTSSSPIYTAASGNASILVTAYVAPSFSLSNTGNIVMSKGATSTSTISITPSGGFAGNVNLSCALTSVPPNATDVPVCSFSPAIATTSSTLTISSTASGSARDQPFRWIVVPGTGIALACVGFLGAYPDDVPAPHGCPSFSSPRRVTASLAAAETPLHLQVDREARPQVSTP